MTTFILYRDPCPDRFVIKEFRDGYSVGESLSFVDPELARICDNIEQMNHCQPLNMVELAKALCMGTKGDS